MLYYLNTPDHQLGTQPSPCMKSKIRMKKYRKLTVRSCRGYPTYYAPTARAYTFGPLPLVPAQSASLVMCATPTRHQSGPSMPSVYCWSPAMGRAAPCYSCNTSRLVIHPSIPMLHTPFEGSQLCLGLLPAPDTNAIQTLKLLVCRSPNSGVPFGHTLCMY